MKGQVLMKFSKRLERMSSDIQEEFDNHDLTEADVYIIGKGE